MEDDESEEAIQDALRPVANILMGPFTEMGHNHKALDHLYQEVKDMDVTDAKKLANLVFLNVCIEETLRLYPALITGGSRMATQKDMTVAGRWIPPYTKIVAPPYLIARTPEQHATHPY
ncbi:hypothetical protein PG987_010139 [Apiospora arundinis]